MVVSGYGWKYLTLQEPNINSYVKPFLDPFSSGGGHPAHRICHRCRPSSYVVVVIVVAATFVVVVVVVVAIHHPPSQ